MIFYQVTLSEYRNNVKVYIFLPSDHEYCQWKHLIKMWRASNVLDKTNILPERWVQPYEKETSMVHHSSKLPSGLLVPTKTNEKLNHVPLNTNPLYPKSQRKQMKVPSKRYPLNSTISEVENSTTTPKPPMIWFPGGNNCNKEEANDSGKYKLYLKQAMLH